MPALRDRIALLNQAHHGRGREGLGGRADAEHRVGVDRQRMVDVGDTITRREGVESVLPEKSSSGSGPVAAERSFRAQRHTPAKYSEAARPPFGAAGLALWHVGGVFGFTKDD